MNNKRLILFILKSFLLFGLISSQQYFDKISTTYDDTNIKMNYVFVNYNEKDDGSEKYIPLSAFYFKNTVASADPGIESKRNGITYWPFAPTVSLNKTYFFTLFNVKTSF